ncbi:MAG TPA: TerB family tellurite resistance protein [Vicinamibacterales bacterium]|nr:TerB family tellurite resistance protein [Vicinamibacterales bacterium]
MKTLLCSWLGIASQAAADEQSALRGLLEALDRLEPGRAKHLAQFAYLLGRIAHADQHVSAEETVVMESLVAREGGLPPDQSVLVVGLAKTSNLLFGGTDNFVVAREFAAGATQEQKLALLRCLFAVSAAENNISTAEEREIQRVARELRIEHAALLALRLEYRRHLPGLSDQTAT